MGKAHVWLEFWISNNHRSDPHRRKLPLQCLCVSRSGMSLVGDRVQGRRLRSVSGTGAAVTRRNLCLNPLFLLSCHPFSFPREEVSCPGGLTEDSACPSWALEGRAPVPALARVTRCPFPHGLCPNTGHPSPWASQNPRKAHWDQPRSCRRALAVPACQPRGISVRKGKPHEREKSHTVLRGSALPLISPVPPVLCRFSPQGAGTPA